MTEREDDTRSGASPTSHTQQHSTVSRDKESAKSDRRKGLKTSSCGPDRRHSQMQGHEEAETRLSVDEKEPDTFSVTVGLNSRDDGSSKVDTAQSSRGEECDKESISPRGSDKDQEAGDLDLSADTLDDSAPAEGMSEYAKRAQEARKARKAVEAEIEAYEKQEAEEEEAKLKAAKDRLSYLKRKRGLLG